MIRHSRSLLAGLVLMAGGFVQADAPLDAPRPVPLTRPEMKQLIEDVKVRTPRIPLPELTDEEREQFGDRDASAGYESRLRRHYLSGIDDGRGGTRGPGGPGQPGGAPGAGRGEGRTGRGGAGGGGAGGFGREQDPNMTLDNAFKVELFWIVSRANNCQYCLGHQESKLLNAGLSEDTIAAIDLDWSGFTPAEQTAFAFARKFTFEPHLLNDADIEGLKKFYTDAQILEMVLSMAGNNSINRWKEGVGVPQRKDEGGYSRMGRNREGGAEEVADNRPRGTYLTPTSPAFTSRVSIVAPIVIDEKTGEATTATVCNRPPLESREQVEQMLAKGRDRQSRLPLVDEAETRTVMGEAWPSDAPVPNWVRLLATFPRAGKSRVSSLQSSDSRGDLTPLMKAQLSWIIARQDRAWYATGQAYARLKALGQTDDQIFSLDGDWKSFTPREQSLFTVAKKLGASPVVLTDAEVTNAVELAGPRDVVQTVSYTTNRASFDRITESAGLPLDN